MDGTQVASLNTGLVKYPSCKIISIHFRNLCPRPRQVSASSFFVIARVYFCQMKSYARGIEVLQLICNFTTKTLLKCVLATFQDGAIHSGW